MPNQISIKITTLFLAFLLLSSCGGKLVYFQEKEGSQNANDKIEIASPPDAKSHILSYGDNIDIQIQTYGTIEIAEKTDVLSPNQTPEYIVDELGYVMLPHIGKTLLGGRKLQDAEKMLLDSMQQRFNNVSVSMRLKSIRVTMLGAFNQPGIKQVPGDHATLIDAIGVAGDLNLNGKPMNIKIVRQTAQGKKIILADLSSLDVFKSEAYYLQSNDIIYAENQKRLFVRENLQYINILASLSNLITIILIQFN